MRQIFGKHTNAFIALFIFQVFIIFVVLIVTFQNSGGPIQSLYQLISKSPGILGMFNTITDFSAVISGFVVCLALGILFYNLRNYQRDRAVIRIHSWARNGVVALAQYRQENADTGDHEAGGFYGVKAVVDKLDENIRMVITDARILGGELNDKTKQTVSILDTIKEKLVTNDDSLYEDLKALQHDMADIMIRAFEKLK